MAGRREFLGTWNTFGSRERIYRTADAVEIDEVTIGDIERRRVFFDDILVITLHRYRGVGFLMFTLFVAVVLSLIGLGMLSDRELAGSVILWICAGLFYALAGVRAIAGVDVLSVFGRRSSARMRFAFRKKRAREVYQGLVEKVRATQELVAREAAPPPPPAALPDALAEPPPSSPV